MATSWWEGTKEKVKGALLTAHNSVVGPQTESSYTKNGRMTPGEFVQAGDLLVQRCRSWAWQPAEASRRVSYLPAEKQYLVTRGMLCRQRAASVVGQLSTADEEDADGFVVARSRAPPAAADDAADIDEIPDIDDIPEVIVEDEDDPAAAPVSDNVVRTRRYDVMVTYDQYYAAPCLWLSGFDEEGRPLQPAEVFADVSPDHAHRTVTITEHPFLGVQCAYTHPCRHADVLKKLMDMSDGAPRVEMALVLFLKFISAAIPTIEYDFTLDVQL